MTTTLPNRIIKYFVDTSNPSQSGFYFYEKAGAGGFVRLGSLADAGRAGGNTFEIDSSTAENVIYNGLGGADTYVVRSNLDKNIEISDPHTGDDGSGNEVKNIIVFDSDVTVTSINQVTRLEEADILRIELTLDTGAVITVNGPDVFQYVVGGVAALDFAGFIATYGASGITPANRAPVFENAPTDLSIDENVDGSRTPVSLGRVAAIDADATDSLTYSIVNAVDQNGGSVTGFEIDGAGLITYVGTGLDAETITSVALTVSASDGEDSAQTSVAISVRNIDEGNARFVVTSNGNITSAAVGDVLMVGTRSADPDGNDAFTYQWYRDGAEIADATGASYTIPEDYNRNSIYVVVRYTDGSGTNEVVTLSGILAPAPVDNIAPAVALGAGAVTSLAENADTSARTKIADLVLTDADGDNAVALELTGRHDSLIFEVDGNVLYLKSGVRLDHEYRDTLNVRVQLNEGTGMGVDVSVAVTNVDDGHAGFVVTSDGDISAAVAGDVLTVALKASDRDGDGAFTYQWYRDGADIAGATGVSYTIPEDYDGNSIYVVVRYTDGGGADETVTVPGIIVPVPTATVLNLADLDPTTGFRLVGEIGDWSGGKVSSVGDINDDGYDDFAIGAPDADPNGINSGSTYIVFGKASGFSRTIELSKLDGSDGFRIDGESEYDVSGGSISAGDVNDDGYNDIIIGAPGVGPDGGYYDVVPYFNGNASGATYVVFGKASGFSETIDLSDIVRVGGGVRIDGENLGDHSGSVSSGDINNDGYDDIIIGANWAEPDGENYDQSYNSGSTYVVFGKADGPNGLNGIMELSELDGSDGFRIDGVNRVDFSGSSVSAGDINGDGYDDVIIGAYGAAPNGYRSGSTYVVFGKASGFSRTMELSELDGSDGFRIDGEITYDYSGKSVSSAGDIDGDGYDDIIISALSVDLNGYNSGSTYVVFGKASGFSRTMELSELDGSDGFRINGERGEDYSGESVSSAGDFNGDGYDDIIIGAYGADPNGFNSGSSYVVFGKASGFSRTIELSELDASDGFRINGENTYAHSGTSVSSAGDIDGDGYDDIIIGASYGGSAEGRSYVIYGHATSVTDVDEGNASFVVTSDGDITAAVAGDVLTVGLRSSDPDGDGTFTYQWYRDGVDIAGATGARYTITEADGGNSLYVAVRYTDGSGADETVTASGVIVPVPEDNADRDTAATLPATPAVLNLADITATTGFRLIGGKHCEFSGSEVSSVGDINDDGYDDFAIGAYAADRNGERSGSTYVIFGKASGFSRTIELSELDGSDGFRIDGESAHDVSGDSISAGDVNDDGYNDIIIGVDWAEPDEGNFGRNHNNGSTYVVFGKSSGFSETIDLSDIVRIGGGVRIDGENKKDYSGYSVSSGDVNDDGYDDIIIGAYGADPNGHKSGSTYVVFGKADGPNGLSGIMELSELDGSDGFRIDGVNRKDYSGSSVSAGDINGDGYDDVIIGAHGADPNGNKSGSTYVVFGKASGFSRTMELSELDGSDGFRIDGVNRKDYSGISVSSAGDIDGDGYDDIIISTPYADLNGYNSGVTYVVFGKASGFSRTMELSELDGSDGFRINGENARDESGYSVSSVGDFNGDGYDDIIIGAPDAVPKGSYSGSSYVVFGKESGFGRVIELSELDGSDGFRIDGENRGDRSGSSVSSAGDVNDDGYDDIIIGASYGGRDEGHSYIIYGHATSVTDADEGNASFVVTSDGDINAAVAGDVLTVGLISSDPDGNGTFSYQWYRDGADIAGATGTRYTIPEDYDGNSIYVVVRYTDGSGVDETITASGIIVPLPADNDDDASEDPVNITYTMTQAPTGVSLTRGDVALSVGETFTYQDVQGGWVALTVNDENALSGLKLTTDDGADANPAEISLDIEVREVADIAAPEVGNDLDYSENEGSLVIDTGDYGDQITAAQGSDFITGGLGDDTINLDPVEGRETGQDTVVYNFGSGSVFTAIDGGDDITGFKRGEDIFLLKTESDNPELATLDGLFSYVSGPNKGSSHDDLMIVTPNYEYEPDGDGGHTFFLTGITFNFEDAGVYGNGYLAKGHVSITFDERLDWDEFLSLIEIDNGDGTIDGNFDHYRGIIRDLSALPNLMGEGSLAYEVEAPAQTPPQDVDVPLEDDIPATSFDVV